MRATRLVLALVLAAAASPALAHTGTGPVSGLAVGLGHPLSGLDHLLAMIAVGLWAARIGGGAVWAVPLAFVAAMVAGGAAGMAGIAVPYVEVGIGLSVVALGALIAAEVRVATVVAMALVGLFALVHGHAHGAELPRAAGALAYALGFALATASLHAVGIGAGLALRSPAGARVVRASGAAAALGGVVILLA